ncbi:probably inactive leucine-rich repeat receptor-like protein kinase At5g48380 [Cicer arietinum]|uniref:Probably inactive leucine-rich repeat receptor-like protein kinase At5g48380 isoform X1 n=1 Tax=Cicer arietinum TaxID=3827 RepID=A0A1S2YUM9_CICAR|nr:probably inactive leucine-rich repeat receptor-like protein kinase At5g48380 isoform X1 [Cicer arietinum]XP_004510192.1 probably inactive leucine-rich repeat receptor-like protein kinase At5g48380 isoform X1 [Cicer arietinum]XP_004510193.1 probably inactive leucine-rich repeat receptor-like protein kinase At5g48380 isoform X1 [Cicer arietinum]XP_004510194.1 probably inactive leucine-rich repeat receptor-like protein kinase At5g48380 isoform X2 [Cicer arietinum]
MVLLSSWIFNSHVFVNFLLLIISWGITYGTETDILCLKSIKESLKDPNGYLKTSWDFNNKTEGFICRFTGVECWHPDENRVLNLKLSNMGLKGPFPRGIINCSSLTGLDLSINYLSGTIPGDISSLLTFVTSLDLSSNEFSGEIPDSLANCTYLNTLKLNQNQLTGQIPLRLGTLARIKMFDVSNNLLTGLVPNFTDGQVSVNYANNQGLCGSSSLGTCNPKGSSKSNTAVIAGVAVGGVTLAALGLAIFMFFFVRRVSYRKKEEDPEGNKWARTMKGTKTIKVSLFEKSISKMKLSDLMKATNNFSNTNIIGSGRTGAVYRATFEDGATFMVKRLQESQRSEKEFMSEMETLGTVKHRNLVPLLGFCVAKKERLLVFKNMPNGMLHDQLHPAAGDCTLDWPLRLKIAIGAAKGLAWLHHSCNPRIIHRNISSKCILLDADFEPKISDFGLARLMNPLDTHLSTFVNGEFGDFGYVAPEYTKTLVATPKGDVFSFGTILLELVTGERPAHVAKAPETFKGNLVEWIAELSSNSQLHDAIDESLVDKGDDNELFQFLKVACNCVTLVPKERPTMFEVYQFLRAIGGKYNFASEDEILVPEDIGNTDNMVELIVAREGNN